MHYCFRRCALKTKDLPRLFSARHNLTALILCAVGVAVNLLLGYIVGIMGLPLYLDTVGTVAIAAMGGYLPGVIVGFATNIAKSILDPVSLYYGILNVLIAALASYFMSRGWFKKIGGIIGSVFVFTLIGGGIGALIPWFMDGLTFDSESLIGVLYETGYFSLEVSNILGSLLLDLPDKVLTVFLLIVILKIIPEKYYDMFSIKGWLQTPITGENAATTEHSEVRTISLKNKIFLVLGSSLILVAAVATAISVTVYDKTLVKEHERLAQSTAKIAASIIDGDRIDEYLKTGGDTYDYNRTKDHLREILLSSTDIAYLYVYKIESDGCHVVFDLDSGDVPGEPIDTVIPFDQEFEDKLDDLMAGKSIDPIITNDRYGHLLTAYEPVYDSNGRCTCYVGADVDMSRLTDMVKSYLTELISVFSGFFIVLCAFVIWLTRYHLILPINSISKCADDLSKATDTQDELDWNVRKIRELDVHTGDEIEALYNSFCKLTLGQAEQMRSIRHLNDSTAKMQDGLIITMADMVENRDSDTGAHIQKTAAYVKIIVEGLKAKGYYAEKITPKFISDVVRSAPLHDVGKINVPDNVLNKPGKLTDEEFEIMKLHTVAGKKIIEDAISTVKGENYLKEARNMAAYHHERWDGNGYPEKLHGEVIPLSARIMAVADVFDALTSPRVYKPAFPLEKALSIIEEGKGKQFDPKCVEVFMDSLPEVRVILQKYNKDA